MLDNRRPHEYAARQIQRARDEVADPLLRELNEHHAVIEDLGGKCRVISEIEDPVMDGRRRISRQSFEDFKNRYLNRRVQVSDKKSIPLGQWWLEHPLRRQFKTLVFVPNRTVEGAYNLWQGFACEPVPGDCSLFLNHVRENICDGYVEYFEYVMNWMARAVQHPDSPGQVAVVLRGGRGTGKSIFAHQFGMLFGPHYLQISDGKHLVGNFNAHLRDTVVLFADEAFFAGDKKHESILKMLVTEPTLMIEGKGVDAESARNYTHLIMASNERWVIPAGADERRYFMLDVNPQRKQDTAYFAAIVDQMDSGGREALLHLLLNRDLSSFEVRTVPQTRALLEQKQLTQEAHEAVMLEMLRTGTTPDPDCLKDRPNWVSVEGFIDAIKERGELPRNTHALTTKIGLYLREFVETDQQGRANITRIKRQVAVSNGRFVPSGFEAGLIPSTVRRTMYKLKPLAKLRDMHRHLVDSWPSSPTEWTDDPEPSELELGRQYEMAMGLSPNSEG